MAGSGWHRKEKAIEALLRSRSIVEASELCGVSTRTYTRYMQDPAFQKRLREAKSELIEFAVAKLVTSARGAVETLQEVMLDKIQPASSRVAASRSVLQLVFDAAQISEIEEKIRELQRKGDGSSDHEIQGTEERG